MFFKQAIFSKLVFVAVTHPNPIDKFIIYFTFLYIATRHLIYIIYTFHVLKRWWCALLTQACLCVVEVNFDNSYFGVWILFAQILIECALKVCHRVNAALLRTFLCSVLMSPPWIFDPNVKVRKECNAGYLKRDNCILHTFVTNYAVKCISQPKNTFLPIKQSAILFPLVKCL